LSGRGAALQTLVLDWRGAPPREAAFREDEPDLAET